MKKSFSIFLLTMTCMLGVSLPLTADAQWHGRGYRNCRFIPAHWRNGVWRPARRVCFRGSYTRCRWVPAQWRGGKWRPARRVCWRVR